MRSLFDSPAFLLSQRMIFYLPNSCNNIYLFSTTNRNSFIYGASLSQSSVPLGKAHSLTQNSPEVIEQTVSVGHVRVLPVRAVPLHIWNVVRLVQTKSSLPSQDLQLTLAAGQAGWPMVSSMQSTPRSVQTLPAPQGSTWSLMGDELMQYLKCVSLTQAILFSMQRLHWLAA